MLKTCLHCGASFEGASQARFCSNAHRVAYSRTRTAEPAQRRPEPELAQDTEQEIRDRFGYAPSETRTKAQRDAAAKRMLAKMNVGPLDPRAFPARPGDLIPSPEKLARLHGPSPSPAT